jgi:uncharacterized protein YjbI with pentapeptide repeats
MPQESLIDKEFCFVHPDCIGEFNKSLMRTSVCKGLPAIYEHEGNYYCVLHFPSEVKSNTSEFLEIVNSKIQKLQNDFTYIFVPDAATFFTKTFPSEVTFNNATFSGQADFRNKTFEHRATFKNAKFLENAIFNNSLFKKGVDFDSATFHKEALFNSTKFSEQADFSKAQFKNPAQFREAKFSHHTFFSGVEFNERVDFYNATFSKTVEFNNANFFPDVNFTAARFLEQAHFFSTTISKTVQFGAATFQDNVFFNFAKIESESKLFFQQAVFRESVCSFYEADIRGHIIFIGGTRRKTPHSPSPLEIEDTGFFGIKSHLDLQNAYIEKPERIRFHSIRLVPSWFINTNAKNFNFTNCDWRNNDNKIVSTISEIKSLENRQIKNSHKLLTKACWQLADNHEEMKSFPEASLFRLMAFESERLSRIEKAKNWRADFGKVFSEQTSCKNIISTTLERTKILGELLKSFPSDFIHFVYYSLSSYGEKWLRAFFWLVFIWILFAFLYTLFGTFGTDKEKISIDLAKSFGYSLQVMTLQRPEPRPYSALTYLIYGLETILAPLQAALLALAIRRKFMR